MAEHPRIGNAVSEKLPDEVRRMWANNQDIARKNGLTLTAQQFAEMFADGNFAPEIESL